MSNKPVKKSDNSKSWIKPRRDRTIRLAPQYHLIVSEGEKTEPNYFEALKREINGSFPDRIAIQINGIGQGANTLSLLDCAIQIEEKSAGKFRHVWLVYDKDDFPECDFDNTVSRCEAKSNESVTYHALWSNECIELWFLLHFMFLQSDLKRKQYYPMLNKYLTKPYKKNRKDIYQLLKPHLKTAIHNAKHLSELNDGHAPSECRPGTNVYEIFEMLGPYIKD